MNLVEELRARAFQGRFNVEAADEIENLQAELAAMKSTRATWDRVLQAELSGLKAELAAEKTTHEAWEQESLKVEAGLRAALQAIIDQPPGSAHRVARMALEKP